MHCTHGPIQVPLTQLSPLSQTCLSCPNSVPPPILPLLFPLQTLLSSKALPVHQPESPALYFSIPLAVRRWGSVLFSRPAEGWREVSVTAPLWQGHFGDGVVGETVWSGGGRVWPWLFCSVEEHNGTTTPQRNAPPNCYYHKKRSAEPI